MVSGNPAEIRGVAAKVRTARQSLDADLPSVESAYNSLHFEVPNKGKIDALLQEPHQKLDAAKSALADFENVSIPLRSSSRT